MKLKYVGIICELSQELALRCYTLLSTFEVMQRQKEEEAIPTWA